MTENKDTLSILLVDDDPILVAVATDVLARLGYKQIKAANDGYAALELMAASEAQFDIIICDLNMPGMDGLEFMRHVDNNKFDGGIILLSGEDKRILETAMNLARSRNLNVLGALEKPIRPDVLDSFLSSFDSSASGRSHFSSQKPITEEELRDGILGSSDNKLLLVFQPKVDIKTGKIIGVETLARWWNAERNVLGPGAFIPLAEASGLIDELTNVIYQKAIIQAAEWKQQGRKLKISINFSVNSFSKSEFCDYLVETAEKYGVAPEQIILEITETQAMEIESDCLEALMRMRLKRFGLSIDDFGTGNSSMAQLKVIPFTELKIDRAFVNGAADDASSLAILETSIDLALKLGMEIVAEGAETREDWDLVERLGCDCVQGFYCARPMSNEDLIKFMDNWTGPH
ncbi:MAG: EAL domain-containing response regulator [Proteobacteria bacterium]|nr:EAL domain-containing response regulator [Pseudomonadota bacterium]